eukprot:1486930-Rhodomonas_salina.1
MQCPAMTERSVGAGNYDNMEDCEWIIGDANSGPVSLSFSEFDLEQGWDLLYVRECSNPACTQVPPSYITLPTPLRGPCLYLLEDPAYTSDMTLPIPLTRPCLYLLYPGADVRCSRRAPTCPGLPSPAQPCPPPSPRPRASSSASSPTLPSRVRASARSSTPAAPLTARALPRSPPTSASSPTGLGRTLRTKSASGWWRRRGPRRSRSWSSSSRQRCSTTSSPSTSAKVSHPPALVLLPSLSLAFTVLSLSSFNCSLSLSPFTCPPSLF